MNQTVLIGIFGLLGIFARYLLDLASVQFSIAYPVSTLVINILGSFSIGALYSSSQFSEPVKIALMVGLLGGFTTYSGYALQTMRLVHEERWMWAIAYFGLTPILCVAAAFAGAAIWTSSV